MNSTSNRNNAVLFVHRRALAVEPARQRQRGGALAKVDDTFRPCRERHLLVGVAGALVATPV